MEYFIDKKEISLYFNFEAGDMNVHLPFKNGKIKRFYIGNWKEYKWNSSDIIFFISDYIKFEIYHSFLHTNLDPNYTCLNWAIYGNLINNVKINENYEH